MTENRGLKPEEWSQLARFDDRWRAVRKDDDPLVVWELRKRRYLDALRLQPPLYRLSEKGHEALDRWSRTAVSRNATIKKPSG